jgi:hypothetical protein
MERLVYTLSMVDIFSGISPSKKPQAGSFARQSLGAGQTPDQVAAATFSMADTRGAIDEAQHQLRPYTLR